MTYKLQILMFIFVFNFSLNISYADEMYIQKRIHNFKIAKKAIKNINNHIIKKEYIKINDEIVFLYNWFSVLPSYFPKGTEASIENNSDASSEIWEKFHVFESLASNSKIISLNMIDDLKQNYYKQIRVKFDQLNQSCSVCHNKFRN